jgi:hypothetical protein
MHHHDLSFRRVQQCAFCVTFTDMITTRNENTSNDKPCLKRRSHPPELSVTDPRRGVTS